MHDKEVGYGVMCGGMSFHGDSFWMHGYSLRRVHTDVHESKDA